MIPTENVASNEAPMSSGFQYTGSVCNERKPLGAGNTPMSQADEESVVPVNSNTYVVPPGFEDDPVVADPVVAQNI